MNIQKAKKSGQEFFESRIQSDANFVMNWGIVSYLKFAIHNLPQPDCQSMKYKKIDQKFHVS